MHRRKQFLWKSNFSDFPTHNYRLEGNTFSKKLKKKLRNKEAIDINEKGVFLELDLEYPKEIHEQECDFPLAPERYNVRYNESSPLNQPLYRKNRGASP